MLKGQDVVLLILLHLRNPVSWTYATLSQALGISASQCHLAMRRLQKVRLVSENPERFPAWSVSPANFREYLIHALKYDFPAEVGPVVRGIPTVHRVRFADRNFFNDSRSPDDVGEYVWPHPKGTLKGDGLKPIHPCQFQLLQNWRQAELGPTEDIYRFLIGIDLIRIGKPGDRKWAIEWLQDRI